MKLRAALVFGAAVAVLGVSVGVNGCSVGGGEGSVTGMLAVPNCWTGLVNLQPDFFAATPHEDTLNIRLQRGSDFENFSDGVSILVTHVSYIRQNMLGQPLAVSLPPAVVPPGVPITADPSPAQVQLSLYLQATCRPETPGLYAMNKVTVNSNGDAGLMCDQTTVAAAAQCGNATVQTPVGTSTITFSHLFDASLADGGDPGSLTAEQRLIQGTFDVILADPRDECPGGVGPPPPCRGHLTGSFSFYFERGQPAQAFP
jgi:hypothetical protein